MVEFAIIKKYLGLLLVVLTTAFYLSGCSGTGGVDLGKKSYSVGGTISGLEGTGLVLVLKVRGEEVEQLSLQASNTKFRFDYKVEDGSTYRVQVFQSPASPSQFCEVSQGEGTISSFNITSVTVQCSSVPQESLLIKVEGFNTQPSPTGEKIGIRLMLPGESVPKDVDVLQNGLVDFGVLLAADDKYDIWFTQLPMTLDCGFLQKNSSNEYVSEGKEIYGVAGNSSIKISCARRSVYNVTGSVTGLQLGQQLTLTLSFEGKAEFEENPEKSIVYKLDVPVSKNLTGQASAALQTFDFDVAIPALFTYNIAKIDPSNQTCSFTNNNHSGQINADVALAVNCSDKTYAISVSANGVTDKLTVNYQTGFVEFNVNETRILTRVASNVSPFTITLSPGQNQTCFFVAYNGTSIAQTITLSINPPVSQDVLIQVDCVSKIKKPQLTVSGLAAGTIVDIAIANNGSSTDLVTYNITDQQNGVPQTKDLNLLSGQSYKIYVKNKPVGPSQTCTVSSVSGGSSVPISGNVGVVITVADNAPNNLVSISFTCIVDSFVVRGSVTGLPANEQVRIALYTMQNGQWSDTPRESVVRTVDGAFAFNSIPDNSLFKVVIPTPELNVSDCRFSDGSTEKSSQLVGGDYAAAIVSCVPMYVVTAVVNGLTIDNSIQINNYIAYKNITDSQTIVGSGSKDFVARVRDGAEVLVSISAQPSGGATIQACKVDKPKFVLNTADLTVYNPTTKKFFVTITCTTARDVGGVIRGFYGDVNTSIVISNNGKDDTVVKLSQTTPYQVGSVLPFTMSTKMAEGAGYNVTVSGQPVNPRQNCSVVNGSGTVGTTDITSIEITCLPNGSAFFADAPDWNDYLFVKPGVNVLDRSKVTLATNLCDPQAYEGCRIIHGGEYRLVDVPQLTSCNGVTITDSLGAFKWQCIAEVRQTGTGNQTFYSAVSTGLMPGKKMSDLLNLGTSAVSWKTLVVRVNGTPVTTPPVLWSNPVIDIKNEYQNISMSGSLSSDKLAKLPGRLELLRSKGVYVIRGEDLLDNSWQYGLQIKADRIALVVQPGFTYSPPFNSGDLSRVVDNSGWSYMWMEGSFNANSRGSGINWVNMNYSVMDNVTVTNSGGGVSISGLTFARFNNVVTYGNRIVSPGTGKGIKVDLVNKSSFHNIVSVGNEANGIDLNNISNSMFSDLYAHDNGILGISITDATNINMERLKAYNNSSDGIGLYGLIQSSVVDVLSTGNGSNGLAMSSTKTNKDNSFLNVNLVANNANGLTINSSSVNNLFINVIGYNNTTGVLLNGSNNKFINGALWANGKNFSYVSSAVDNALAGWWYMVGATGGGCYKNSVLVACVNDAQNPSNNDFVITDLENYSINESTDMSAVFLGSINYVNGGVNSAVLSHSTLDANSRYWFENVDTYQSWNDVQQGVSTVSLVRGRCLETDSACGLWDWHLKANTVLFVNPLLEKGQLSSLVTNYPVSTMSWSNGTTSTFLNFATEIGGDGIGNDNGICDSDGEHCVFTSNIGFYQGHGGFSTTTTTIHTSTQATNILMRQYSANGLQ